MTAGPSGKSHLSQDTAWLAKKLAHQVTPPGWNSRNPQPLCTTPCGASRYLDTSVTTNTIEPWGSTPGTTYCTNDDNSPAKCYFDRNYWGFCGPGTVANALQYWGASINTYPANYKWSHK